MYSEAESSATSNSLPPTMRSKTSRPDLSVMQLRSTPSTGTSPSRMASSRSYRQLAKVKGRRDTAAAQWRGEAPRKRANAEAATVEPRPDATLQGSRDVQRLEN